MAYLGNVPPPSCLGFLRNPHLVLPPYIISEVHLYTDEDGNLITHRRPRPLSIIAGAQVVLQSDQDRLARFVLNKSGIRTVFRVELFAKRNKKKEFDGQFGQYE